MNSYTIGKEIEAYCGKCKINTLHIITAMTGGSIDKGMCKICLSYHKIKQPNTATAKSTLSKNIKGKTMKQATKRTRRNKWTRLLDDSDRESAVEYQMDKEYEVASTIHHKNFGLGVVKNIIDNRKIEVLFHDGEKILVQNLQR